MVELINGIHHKPLTTYSVDYRTRRVMRRALYPHKSVTVAVTGPMWTWRAYKLAEHLNSKAG